VFKRNIFPEKSTNPSGAQTSDEIAQKVETFFSRFIHFLLDNLNWLIALGLIAGVSQVKAH